MKNRITLSLLFVVLVGISTPASADAVSSFLFGLARGAAEQIGKGVINAVASSATSPAKKEPPATPAPAPEKDTEAMVDELLLQFPEEDREARRAAILAAVGKAKQQVPTIEAVHKEPVAEGGGAAAFIADVAASAVSAAVNHSNVFDIAAQKAALRIR